MLALLVVTLLVLLLRLTFKSCGWVCLLKVFLAGFTICVVDSPDTGYFNFGVDGYKFFTGELSLTDFEDKSDVIRHFLELVSMELSIGVVFDGCCGITKALVCLSSDRSLHNADIKGRSIFRLFSRRVRMSSSPSALSFSKEIFFSSPHGFVTKGWGAEALGLVGIAGGVFFI